MNAFFRKILPFGLLLCHFSPIWSQEIILKTRNIFANDKIDDAEPINKIILEENSDILTIVFEEGEYILNSPLRIEKQVNFILTDQTILRVNNEVGGILVFTNNFKISGGKIICSPTKQIDYVRGFGILIQGSDSCMISNVTISEFPISGIVFIANGKKGCNFNKVINNRLETNDNFGFLLADRSAIMLGYSGTGYSHDNNLIEHNIIKGNFVIHHGISLIGHGKTNLVKGNQISECASYGILFYEIQSDPIDYTIVDNQIFENQIENIGNKGSEETAKGMGIYLMKTFNTIVKGNKINNVLEKNGPAEPLPPGGIALNTSVNCSIIENTISNSSKYGLAAIYSKNLIINGNKISNTGYQPIYICYANDVLIQKNSLIAEGKEVLKLKYGNTNEVNLPKEAFKSSFFQLETGEDIAIDSNTIIVKKFKTALLIDGPESSKSVFSLTLKNNKFEMAGKEIFYSKDLSKKIITINNIFVENR